MLCPLWMTPSPPSRAIVLGHVAPGDAVHIGRDNRQFQSQCTLVSCERSPMAARLDGDAFMGSEQKVVEGLADPRRIERECLFIGASMGWYGQND